MKITIMMMLLFVAFSAVALAEESIKNSALDTVVGRTARCMRPNEYCNDFFKCCGRLNCQNNRCKGDFGRK